MLHSWEVRVEQMDRETEEARLKATEFYRNHSMVFEAVVEPWF